jgi:MarR family 2-MHQ and catechol resistance regulon transcriptional repressor
MRDEIRLAELFRQINKNLWKKLSMIIKGEQFSITEISVLFMVHKRKTIRMSELATRIGIPASTLTGILDRLVAQGFLERRQDPSDRRSVLVSTTAKLKLFFNEQMAPMVLRLRAAFRCMSDSRITRLSRDLQFLLDHLDQEDYPKE